MACPLTMVPPDTSTVPDRLVSSAEFLNLMSPSNAPDTNPTVLIGLVAASFVLVLVTSKVKLSFILSVLLLLPLSTAGTAVAPVFRFIVPPLIWIDLLAASVPPATLTVPAALAVSSLLRNLISPSSFPLVSFTSFPVFLYLISFAPVLSVELSMLISVTISFVTSL